MRSGIPYDLKMFAAGSLTDTWMMERAISYFSGRYHESASRLSHYAGF